METEEHLTTGRGDKKSPPTTIAGVEEPQGACRRCWCCEAALVEDEGLQLMGGEGLSPRNRWVEELSLMARRLGVGLGGESLWLWPPSGARKVGIGQCASGRSNEWRQRRLREKHGRRRRRSSAEPGAKKRNSSSGDYQ